MNLTIKKLSEDDWREFSKIRLAALQSDPSVFGSNYEKESKFGETYWRARLSGTDNAVFMLFDSSNPIGITGISIDRADPDRKSAVLWGSWLAPEYRGRGLSKIMYRARLDWAANHPTVEKIIVSHRASNLASKRANQKHGFVFTHKTEKIWIDGATEDEIFYEIKIKN